MRNRTYGGVRGRKTKVGRKLLRFPPTRLTDTGRNAMMKYVEALKTYSLIFSEDFGAKAYDISITQSCPFNNSKYCQKSSCGDSFFSQPTLYTSERERSRDTTRSNRTLCSPNVAMSQHTVTRSSSPL